VSVATIRYWTKEGLLEVAEKTEFGYQLYDADMVERCNRIRQLKQQRLTLSEIRQQFP